MSDPYTDPQPISRMAPPTDPGTFIIPPAESGWPKVIGVIVIVFASVATLLGLLGLVSVASMEKMTAMMPEGGAETLAVMQEWKTMLTINGLLAVGVAVLAIVAGARLIQRHPGAPGLGRAWAVLKIIIVLVTAATSAQMQNAQFAAMQQSQTASGAAMPPGWSEYMVIFSAAITVLWGWALPVFLLIWLSRSRIKEETARWGDVSLDPLRP